MREWKYRDGSPGDEQERETVRKPLAKRAKS